MSIQKKGTTRIFINNQLIDFNIVLDLANQKGLKTIKAVEIYLKNYKNNIIKCNNLYDCKTKKLINQFI
jgi:hypothetical protein